MAANDYMKKRMEHILSDRPLPEKKKYSIPKIGKKRAEKEKQQKESGSDSELDMFFEDRRKRLKGVCFFCHCYTTWKNDSLWRIAIAHLLPKSKFLSVATNENNWVELCMECHRSFDDGMISWEMLYDSHEWKYLKPKLELLLPLVKEEERKNKLYSKLEKLIYGHK